MRQTLQRAIVVSSKLAACCSGWSAVKFHYKVHTWGLLLWYPYGLPKRLPRFEYPCSDCHQLVPTQYRAVTTVAWKCWRWSENTFQSIRFCLTTKSITAEILIWSPFENVDWPLNRLEVCWLRIWLLLRLTVQTPVGVHSSSVINSAAKNKRLIF